jgi:hypothetical protein
MPETLSEPGGAKEGIKENDNTKTSNGTLQSEVLRLEHFSGG